jgi:carboxylesterase type B
MKRLHVVYYFVLSLAELCCCSSGFLNTEHSKAPGNYALFDQVAALQWLKENIQPFGGDPNEVTLLGHGYGGALVNLLLVSPVTKGESVC